MKMFMIVSILACSLTSLARTYTLSPGQSLPLGDGSQVLCQGGGYAPPPPPPMMSHGPSCTVKFNPTESYSCSKYVVYDENNRNVSDCLQTLNEVTRTLHDLSIIGTCSRVATTACTVKFNPTESYSCSKYVVYGANGKAVSECLTDLRADVEPALMKLKQAQVCAW